MGQGNTYDGSGALHDDCKNQADEQDERKIKDRTVTDVQDGE